MTKDLDKLVNITLNNWSKSRIQEIIKNVSIKFSNILSERYEICEFHVCLI